MHKVKLGVNIDHIATIRQARGTDYPSPVKAATLAVAAGADGITLHLREDRRHIQEQDVAQMKQHIQVPINLEMAVTEAMLQIAEKYQPEHCCLVPEKRQELTTEGGLDILANEAQIKVACARLAKANIEVSLFIDPDHSQIDAAKRCQAPVIELHTGCYADATDEQSQQAELQRIIDAANYAHQLGFTVNAGHGLHYQNTAAIANIPVMNELNIGHSIVAESLYIGITEAVKKMKALLP